MNEKDALAMLFVNLKDKKKKSHDWITIARNAKYLTELYGSYTEVAKKTSTSTELIRQVVKILELTPDNQERIKQKKILMDAGSRLASIRDESLQNTVGELIENLDSLKARQLIRFAKYNEDAPLEDFKVRLLSFKEQIERFYLTIIPLNQNLRDNLKEKSIKQNTSIEQLILDILEDYFSKGGNI